MPRRELPSFRAMWKTHETIYLQIFSTALEDLVETDISGDEEDAISEKLTLSLKRACLGLSRSRNQEVAVPVWEAPIPPIETRDLTGGKRGKRPDFTCTCQNFHAQSPEDYEVSLHVACKRLGNPTSPSWNLNENYVKNGIKRFDCSSHKYGNQAPSGLMIGYITAKDPGDIEREVNGYQKKHTPHCPPINFNSSSGVIRKTTQVLCRKNVEPGQFKLFHMWGDFRSQ